MINVSCTSAYMNAYGGAASTYIGNNPNNPVQGMLRLQNSSTLQVFDGSGWIDMNISVGLDAQGEEANTWVRNRMAQEQRWAQLAEQHPAVANAVAAREQAEQALGIVSKLFGKLET